MARRAARFAVPRPERERLASGGYRRGEIAPGTLQVGQVRPGHRHVGALGQALLGQGDGLVEVALHVEADDVAIAGVHGHETLGVVVLRVALLGRQGDAAQVAEGAQLLDDGRVFFLSMRSPAVRTAVAAEECAE